MRKHKGKILAIVCILLSIICITINAYAHSGGTDSSGGHRDSKNKSGLGGYHYHCGSHPAHLHENGVCPYSSSKKTSSSSSTKKSSKSTTASSKKTTTVKASGIQINKNVSELEVGDSKYMTATISPSNTTDKSIQWKSSDETIATINQNGVITAKKSGIVTITASTTNGKTNTVKISIKEKAKVDESNTNTITAIQNSIDITINTTTNTISNITNNTIGLTNTTTSQANNHIKEEIEKENSQDSNPIVGILALGVLGGGGYLGYKKYKSQK